MTNEEAIRHLQAARLMLLGKDNQPISDLYYALDMAIHALEQTQPQDGDLISRTKVDEYIVKLLDGFLYAEERTRLENLDAFIWELPSVSQPQDGDADYWKRRAKSYERTINKLTQAIENFDYKNSGGYLKVITVEKILTDERMGGE